MRRKKADDAQLLERKEDLGIALTLALLCAPCPCNCFYCLGQIKML
jgi:hypothetical protein